MEIQTAISTYEGEDCINRCLECLHRSLLESEFELHSLVVDYRPDDDNTDSIISEYCDDRGWDYEIHEGERNLAESRQFLIGELESDWFLFLDDDVYITDSYLDQLQKLVNPRIGAIQGRKTAEQGNPSGYLKRRVQRGTLFATLIQRRAIEGINIPSDCVVLEDEYIRQHIQSNGYLWIMHPDIWLTHDSQCRHGIGYREGYLAGKYGLLTGDYVLLNVPYQLIRKRNPFPHATRALGYLLGMIRHAD